MQIILFLYRVLLWIGGLLLGIVFVTVFLLVAFVVMVRAFGLGVWKSLIKRNNKKLPLDKH